MFGHSYELLNIILFKFHWWLVLDLSTIPFEVERLICDLEHAALGIFLVDIFFYISLFRRGINKETFIKFWPWELWNLFCFNLKWFLFSVGFKVHCLFLIRDYSCLFLNGVLFRTGISFIIRLTSIFSNFEVEHKFFSMIWKRLIVF